MSEKLAAGRKAKAAETEAALKAAALRVFAERGYLNTKIVDITAEAGRAAGSFYNHFTGKEELLQAMLTDMLVASDEAILAGDSTHSSDFTDFAAVRWHVAAFWAFYKQNRVVMIALRQAALVNREFSARLQEMITADQEHMIGHLRFVTRAGRALPGDVDVSLALMQSMLDGFMQRWDASPVKRVSDADVVDTIARFLYRAFNGCDPS
jgi:AcrR family transcriptional regulator